MGHSWGSASSRKAKETSMVSNTADVSVGTGALAAPRPGSGTKGTSKGGRRGILSPERIEEIIRGYESGESAAVLAARNGVSVFTILYHLRKHRVVLRPKGRPLVRPAQADAMIEDYRAGMPVHEITAKHGLSTGTLYNLIRRRGVDLRGYDGRNRVRAGKARANLDLAAAAFEYDLGRSIREVAAAFGVSSSTLHRALVQYGVRMRSMGRGKAGIDRASAVADYESGVPVSEIAAKHQVAVSTVYKWLAEGVDLRGRGRPRSSGAAL